MMVENHYLHRIGWLRAGVLGANDGILSTTSLVIGVAAASAERPTVLLAALSGLIGGAFSMAAGEYISVSSQSDTERADIAREKKEQAETPEAELEELVAIYAGRGLNESLAREVAKELTQHDALKAHLRDELGITEITTAKPFQAALASFASFVAGAALPLVIAVAAPLKEMVFYQYGFSLVFLLLLGGIAAKTGGAPVDKSMLRIGFWGSFAMAATAFAGHFFGHSGMAL